MTYVMSFAAAVPSRNKAAYEEHCRLTAKIFKEFGALRVVECWGGDVPAGEVTSYPMAVQAADDETVVTGWQEWPDKATSDAAWQKAMQDKRFETMQMPFDGKRMIFGGFEVLLEE